MYLDRIFKQAEEPIQQKKVFSDKDEEMFVSIFKADDDTGEELENPDQGGGQGGNAGAQGGNQGGNDDAGESLENPDEGGQQQGGNQGGDDENGEELENPDQGGDQGGNQGGEDNGSGEELENPDQGGQDPNAQQGQDPNAQPQPGQDPNQQQGEDGESESEKKIKDINERIQLFRKHRKLEDTVQVLYDAVSNAIGQVVTTDSRIKLLRIQKDLLVTKGQLEYAISLDFKTIDMDKATDIYKVLEKKVSLMSDTLRKIRKENAEV
jgi:hypothetical protein